MSKINETKLFITMYKNIYKDKKAHRNRIWCAHGMQTSRTEYSDKAWQNQT